MKIESGMWLVVTNSDESLTICYVRKVDSYYAHTNTFSYPHIAEATPIQERVPIEEVLRLIHGGYDGRSCEVVDEEHARNLMHILQKQRKLL